MNSRFKFPNKKIVALGFCLLLLLNVAAAPLAKASTGSGDGSGGGKGNPLSLVQSSPAHGEQDVHLTGEIKLSFNKNVVHMTVCDDNKQCFALYAEDGTAVPVEVIMADDQMEPEKRRDIVLKPQQELAAGTAYTVKVAPALRAKNGTTLGTEATVTFTTAGAAPATATAPAAPAGETSGRDPGDMPVSSEPVADETPMEQPAAEPEPPTEEAPATGEADTAEPADTEADTESAAEKANKNSTAVPLVITLAALCWIGYRSYKKYRAQ